MSRASDTVLKHAPVFENEGRYQLPGPSHRRQSSKKSAPLTLRQGRVYGSRLGENANRLFQTSDAKNSDNEPHCAPDKLGSSVIHNENGAIHRNGGNVAGRIQQCGCRRALFFHAGVALATGAVSWPL
jgi:hypothetical protein